MIGVLHVSSIWAGFCSQFECLRQQLEKLIMINQTNPGRVSVSQMSVSSGKSALSHVHMDIDPISNFDHGKIIEHYRRMRESQHQKLAAINMGEEMKRKLFGFSEGYYLTNQLAGRKLVIEDHPLRGKIVQTAEKYEQRMITKQKEKDIRSARLQEHSISNVHSENRADFDSDLQLHINHFFNGLEKKTWRRQEERERTK